VLAVPEVRVRVRVNPLPRVYPTMCGQSAKGSKRVRVRVHLSLRLVGSKARKVQG